MARAKATVPTPTRPPRKNPVTSIIISMELRISRILFPVFLLNPNIKPSLCHAPRFALIYSPEPIPMRIIPNASIAI